jgi:hypothetical protein
MVGKVVLACVGRIRSPAAVVLSGSAANITELSRHGKSIGFVPALSLPRSPPVPRLEGALSRLRPGAASSLIGIKEHAPCLVIKLARAAMYGLIAFTELMTGLMRAEAWFVLSALLAPTGYVIQDVIADAMTVEGVPATDVHGNLRSEAEVKAMHTTMQTLGRVATIGGFVLWTA